MNTGLLSAAQGSRRVLLAVAAPAEARAVLAGMNVASADAAAMAERPWTLQEVGGAKAPGRFDLVVTGIGKANAAGAVARCLEPHRHAAVLSLGIAGALPVASGAAELRIGSVVLAAASVYADEGVSTPTGFSDCAAMGFPLGPFSGSAIDASPELLAALSPVAQAIGRVATVSTCSGLDELAGEVVRRTGAVAEAMEGAAVAHVAARIGVPAAELRVISNTTGRRDHQRWDIRAALAKLGEVSGRL